jgi:hypothetical protein
MQISEDCSETAREIVVIRRAVVLKKISLAKHYNSVMIARRG